MVFHGLDLNETACMHYAPITSMNVKRAYSSTYKNIRTAKRLSFEDNLTEYGTWYLILYLIYNKLLAKFSHFI